MSWALATRPNHTFKGQTTPRRRQDGIALGEVGGDVACAVAVVTSTVSMSLPDDVILELRTGLAERREVLERIARTNDEAGAVVELDQARIGRLSRMDALQSQAMALEIRRRNARELAGIGKALERIDSGEYGFCLRCEEAIGLARLRANPTATLCIQCADRAARR